MLTYTIDLKPFIELTDDQFFQLCCNHPDIKFERSAGRELIIVPPTGGETGNRNFEIATEFGIWNRQYKLGVCFDSSTGFNLPNGGDRAPDVAWVRQDRWDTLTPEQKEKFPPIAPDFVLELMSPSDKLSDVQAKMQEYMTSGVRLGWLIDRKTHRVEIYRLNQPVDVLQDPETLSGEDVLPEFVLSLNPIW
ncbi:MAG: Uma2 family endonuclease [Myxacorys chilensis ATA2-1-KO14]|jgi:Uma2 family endonuclease|nr:Uma2 family endonuclease [Myxacorys chilensis ATA2-1-KO14]